MPKFKSLPGIGDDYESRFFMGDIVFFKQDPELRAFVARSWLTEEDDEFDGEGPLERPLLLGEVGLRVGVQGHRAIEPESNLELLSRNVDRGDLVKRNAASPEVAIVLSTHVEVQLETALECLKIDDWIPMDSMTSVARFREGDYVVSEGWLGMVTMVGQIGCVEPGDVVRSLMIHDTCGIMQVGDRVVDVVEQYQARGVDMNVVKGDSQNDRIYTAAPYGVEVSWLAMNQKIPVSEQSKYPMPQSWYEYKGIDRLVTIRKALDRFCHIGRSYVFKDETDYDRYGLPARYGESTVGGATPLRVKQFRTRARLQWPDGRITENWVNSLLRHDNLDEHESWPGQHVIWSDDANQQYPAVVQRYDPVQRIVDIRLSGTEQIESVSVLEVEHNSETEDDYGVTLGEYVFICNDSGSPMPHVPAIGLTPVASMNALAVVSALERQSDLVERVHSWSNTYVEPNDIDWIGEVVSLELDGRLGVRLANGETVTLELKNVLLLKPMEEGDMMDEDSDSGRSSETDYGDAMRLGPTFSGSISALTNIVLANARRQRQTREADDGASDASWETAYSEEDLQDSAMSAPMTPDTPHRQAIPHIDAVSAVHHNHEAQSLPSSMDLDGNSDDADWVDESIEMAPSSPPIRESRSPSLPLMTSHESNAEAGPSSVSRTITWDSFVVLDSAPSDHQFFRETPASSSRARMKKINAEHKALRTSLPDNIVVRAYEDRLDLLRVLIIGPEGTPYAGAPFVFDVFLNPSYPFQPPNVHFHSHTNGKGRCNPNLYEEGKVCLSILGTWSGDASESWDSERSSLLQVFVSISGLVLVRNPYHCEPAYAKLEGTREGAVNSRLYSEKAYILSRGFVKQALAFPPAGLQDGIRHYYYTTGHLREVVDHARALMDQEADVQSRDEGDSRWNADVIGSLTAGAKLSLRRIYQSLEKTWLDHQASLS